MKQHLRYKKYLELTIIAVFMLAGFALANAMSSPSYTLDIDVISGGGGDSSSASYDVSHTTGQSSAIGESSSTNYKNNAGFSYTIFGMVYADVDIKANGSDGPLIITSSQNLKLTIALDDGSMAGTNADWWVLCDTSMFGWYHYDLSSWEPGIVVTYQGPLFDLGTYQVMDYVLPAGNYTCYFGVDIVVNGVVDTGPGQIFYDSVQVTITP